MWGTAGRRTVQRQTVGLSLLVILVTSPWAASAATGGRALGLGQLQAEQRRDFPQEDVADTPLDAELHHASRQIKSSADFRLLLGDGKDKPTHYEGSFTPLHPECSINIFMAWTTGGADAFDIRYRRALESVFYHMPQACIQMLSYELTDADFQQFKDAGYKIEVASIEDTLKASVPGTPLEEWYKNWDVYKKEKFIYSNVTNALRMLLLYKYGGVYLDTDVIVLRPLYRLINSVAVEHGTLSNPISVNGAIMGMEKDSPFVWSMMEEFVAKYNGNKWGNNGPRVVTAAVKKHMKDNDPKVLRLLPKTAFYPVTLASVANWFSFKKADSKAHSHMLKKIMKHGVCFHYWNRHSAEYTPEFGTLMYKMFNDYCVFCDQKIVAN